MSLIPPRHPPGPVSEYTIAQHMTLLRRPGTPHQRPNWITHNVPPKIRDIVKAQCLLEGLL